MVEYFDCTNGHGCFAPRKKVSLLSEGFADVDDDEDGGGGDAEEESVDVWEATIEPTSGDVYFVNTSTNASQWEHPPPGCTVVGEEFAVAEAAVLAAAPAAGGGDGGGGDEEDTAVAGEDGPSKAADVPTAGAGEEDTASVEIAADALKGIPNGEWMLAAPTAQQSAAAAADVGAAKVAAIKAAYSAHLAAEAVAEAVELDQYVLSLPPPPHPPLLTRLSLGHAA
jgi:hypothetical protein